MLGRGWLYQWERVGRRLEAVHQIYAGRTGGTESAVDDVQSFFEVLHHLGDWLKNDPACPLGHQDIRTFVKAHPRLQLCGDLANGSKHFALTKAWTKDLSTTIERSDVTVLVGTGTSKQRFYATSGGVEYDVLRLAEGAVGDWTSFLRSHGLIA
jgi:hypothetical protein